MIFKKKESPILICLIIILLSGCATLDDAIKHGHPHPAYVGHGPQHWERHNRH